MGWGTTFTELLTRNWKEWMMGMSVGWWMWILWREFELRWNRRPPMVSSSIPWIGCVAEFGRCPPAKFLEQSRQRYGDVFTVHVGGRRLTFLMAEELYPTFFDETTGDVDFTTATQPFLTRGFGVARDDYVQHHHDLLRYMRNALSPAHLGPRRYAEVLTSRWARELPQWRTRIPLQESLRQLVFDASLLVLFGESFGTSAAIRSSFETFDGQFELASSAVPHAFLPAFTRARAMLLQHLRTVACSYEWKSEDGAAASFLKAAEPFHTVQSQDEASTPLLAQELLQMLGTRQGESWLLAVMWAAEANSIPVSFWTLAHIVSDDSLRSRVLAEVADLPVPTAEQGWTHDLYQSRLKLTAACVREAIRMHSAPMIVRMACRELSVRQYKVAQGDFVCLSPLWHGRSSQRFPDPDRFLPDRWLRSSQESEPLDLAFGGGSYRCPGRSFALMEVTLLVALVLRIYPSIRPLGDIPDADWNSLVGIQKPCEDLMVQIDDE